MEPQRSLVADNKHDDATPPPSPSPPVNHDRRLSPTHASSFSTSSPEIEIEIETPPPPPPPSMGSQTPEKHFSEETTAPDFPSPWDEPADPIITESEMMGAGLVNMGNTCFLNVILQCFTHTVPFVHSLRSTNHPTPCHRYTEGFCVLCALRDHIELALSSSGRSVAPYKLVNNLSYLSTSFRRYEQEDAHEFLQCLLDKLDSCDLDVRIKDSISPHKEQSFVSKVFGGRLKSQLRCSNCGHCSDTFEPLIDLSLEIEDVDSLPSALESFTKVEKIEETRFPCGNCKEDVLVEKKLTLEQTPSVAAFHLKRFKNTGSYVDKIDKYVEYPLELDLQPYISNQETNNVESKYELYAVVVHTGYSSSSGHYFCFIRSSPQTWHRLDDYKVTRVREDFVLSQEAYILFYARQGTPWFSSLMETQKQCAVTSPNSVLDDVETPVVSLKHRVTTSPPSVDMKAQKRWITISPKSALAHPINKNELHHNTSGDREDVEKAHTVVPLNKFNEELEKATENVDLQPLTPPSPEIYSKNEPETSYNIPRDHLNLKNKPPLIKSADNALEDSKRKEAFRLTRSMPSSRANKFRACMLSPPSEGSRNRKKRKMTDGLSNDKSSPSGVCRKLSPSMLSSVC